MALTWLVAPVAASGPLLGTIEAPISAGGPLGYLEFPVASRGPLASVFEAPIPTRGKVVTEAFNNYFNDVVIPFLEAPVGTGAPVYEEGYLSATITWQMPITPILGGNISAGPINIAGGLATPVVLGPVIASGNNTITVPTGSTGFIFTPKSGNTVVLTLKGASGDTGFTIPKDSSYLGQFSASAPANIVINAASDVGQCELIFI